MYRWIRAALFVFAAIILLTMVLNVLGYGIPFFGGYSREDFERFLRDPQNPMTLKVLKNGNEKTVQYARELIERGDFPTLSSESQYVLLRSVFSIGSGGFGRYSLGLLSGEVSEKVKRAIIVVSLEGGISNEQFSEAMLHGVMGQGAWDLYEYNNKTWNATRPLLSVVISDSGLRYEGARKSNALH